MTAHVTIMGPCVIPSERECLNAYRFEILKCEMFGSYHFCLAFIGQHNCLLKHLFAMWEHKWQILMNAVNWLSEYSWRSIRSWSSKLKKVGVFFGKKASCRKKHLRNKHFPNVKNKKEMGVNNHECKLQVLKYKCLIEKAKESVE